MSILDLIYLKEFGYHFLKSLKYLSEESKKSNLITLGIGSTIERSISLSLLLIFKNSNS